MSEVRIMPPDAKIGDEPIKAVYTGFRWRGQRIFLEGDDAKRFVREMERRESIAKAFERMAEIFRTAPVSGLD